MMHSYTQQRDFKFELNGKPLSLTLSLDPEKERKLKAAPHSYSYTGSLPRGWREEYYRMFLSHPEDQATARQVLDGLRHLHPGTDDDTLAELAVAFVQGSISYDWETFHNIDQGRIRYPYETLFAGTGVCADKTILLARLLRALDYGVAIFSFDRANHMALGLRVPQGYGHYRTNFTFVESTDYNAIGTIPEKYHGGTSLERNPKVVELGGSKTFRKIEQIKAREAELEQQYGKSFLQMNPRQQELKKQMMAMEQELDELKQKLKGCRGTLQPAQFQECQRIQQAHNQKVEAYNALVNRFNQAN